MSRSLDDLRTETYKIMAIQEPLLAFWSMSRDIFVIRDKNRILQINPAATHILGWTHDQFLHMEWWRLFHQHDREDAIAGKTYHCDDGIDRLRSRLRTSNDKWRVIEWTTSPNTTEGLCYAVGRDLGEWTGGPLYGGS
jgi:PAS domain S-box-containing protein